MINSSLIIPTESPISIDDIKRALVTFDKVFLPSPDANQALASYNKGIYDGCSVLSRKLVEILIIECFEKHKCENLIQNQDGTFYYLSDLITEFLKEPSWNIGRNAKNGLPKIKKLGDLSAHNRRYIARKGDLDNIKDEVRVVIEELLHLIDYENWSV